MDIITAREWANEIKKNGGFYSDVGNGYKCFVKDGIVCEEKWESVPQNLRILVILRETREQTDEECKVKDEDEIFSLEKYLTKENKNSAKFEWHGGSVRSTYMVVAQWINAIFTHYRYKHYDNLAESTDNIFDYVAVINLKKTPGGNKSDANKIKDFCDVYSERLRRQIREINPDIVILGNERKNLFRIMGTDICEHETIKRNQDGFNPLNLHVCELKETNSTRPILVFDAYHPSSYRYYTACDDFEFVLNKYDERKKNT